MVTQNRLFAVSGSLSVDAQAAPDALRRIKRHWARVGCERIASGGLNDWSAYNVVSVSAADLERVKLRLSEAFRGIQGIVAASELTERAALVLLQLVQWGDSPTPQT